ncbi:MAG: phenylalanine--tRNA ligase subunit beta [Candidatus Calescibacterium sp.]|nr:phenylalanine--tRNA ligase subunit beta [Candidatus Calescibacterium sp.]MDW8132617.1 phenylalanine--tRNA ligase subunit beta [Candidatus Calescibacterium sp.]
MLIPLVFFNRYLGICDKDLLVDTLFRIGIQVENVYEVGHNLDNVRIGKIVYKEKHPNADRIYVCKVNLGNDIIQVLTADSSVEIGDIVLVAVHGCVLPNGLKIENRKIRGLDSYGMMLSTEELGWENVKAYGSGVSKFNFDSKLSSNVGKNLNQVIRTRDWVIEIQPLPNKVETLGVYHLCKEMSFFLNCPFRNIESITNFGNKIDYEIKILSPYCKYYKAIILNNVEIDYSPVEFQLVLSWMGTKPINNVVDLTNFLMYEFSQPLHAFDMDDIDGFIVVRQGNKKEVIQALDGKDYEVEETDIIISDGNGKTLALAGVIGSRNFSIKEGTSNVIIEIANFNSSSVRKTSKRLGLFTNSSKRFDKNIPSVYVDFCHGRFIELISEFGLKCDIPGYSFAGKPEFPKSVDFSVKKINEFIGVEFNRNEIERILKLFAVDFIFKNDDEVQIKTYRNDINAWWDIAEEFCRFRGFGNLARNVVDYPEKIYLSSFNDTYFFVQDSIHKIDQIRDKFVCNGYLEVIGYNLMNPIYLDIFGKEFIKIDNYMSIDHSAYRNSVLPSVINIASNNYKAGYKHLKIFEIGKVFNKKEYYQLGFVAYSEMKSFISDPDKFVIFEIERLKNIFYDLNLVYCRDFVFLNPAYQIFLGDQNIGIVGVLNDYLLDYFYYPPYTLVGQIDLDKLTVYGGTELFSDFSEFPPIYKDVSFYTSSSFNYHDFLRLLDLNFSNKVKVSRCYLIDIYKLDNENMSYTFRLELKPKFEITNQEINDIINSIFNELSTKGIYRRGT